LKFTVITKVKAKEFLNKIIDAVVGNNIKALVKKYRYIISYSNGNNLSSIYLIAPEGKYISVYADHLERWNQLIIKEKRVFDWPSKSLLLQIQVYADIMELKKRNRINNIDNLDFAKFL
jgi:hypothetical protein